MMNGLCEDFDLTNRYQILEYDFSSYGQEGAKMRWMVGCFIMFFNIAISVNAAAVTWNCVESSWNQGTLSVYCDIGWRSSLGFDMVVSADHGDYIVNHGAVIVSFLGNVLVANPGDLINETSTRHLDYSQYFIHSWIDDWEGGGDEVVHIRGEENFYMAFVLGDGYDSRYAYGWMNIGVDARGNLSLLGSAIDLDGGPMIVGGGSASPEPSGALLLLLGVGMLGLRRQRPKRV